MTLTLNHPDFYHAARGSAAVLRQPWNRGLLRLSGPERISWLQGMVSNDVEKLHPGQGVYAAHLNAQGKIVGQMTILVDDDFIWLSMEASNVKKLADVLDRMIVMEDVQCENLTENFESIAVIGPQAASVLATWLGEPVNLDEQFSHRSSPKCARILRDELGFTVWADIANAASAVDGIVAAGATLIDEATWNVIRIEAGLPIYGIDIDESTTLPEIGEKGIRYDKGCYIGQEVVARIKYIGHVNRRFMGLILEGESLPAPGSVARFAGKDVGHITSSAFSLELGKVVALGYLSRNAAVSRMPGHDSLGR